MVVDDLQEAAVQGVAPWFRLIFASRRLAPCGRKETLECSTTSLRHRHSCRSPLSRRYRFGARPGIGSWEHLTRDADPSVYVVLSSRKISAM